MSALPRKHIACVSWFGVLSMCVKSRPLEDTNSLHSADLTQSMPIPEWRKHFDESFAQVTSSSVSIPCFQPTEGFYEEHKPPLTVCFASNLLSSVGMSTTTRAAFSFHAGSHRGCSYTQGDVKLYGRLQDEANIVSVGPPMQGEKCRL